LVLDFQIKKCNNFIEAFRLNVSMIVQSHGVPLSTIYDVAKQAKVSLSTVSYAINGTRPISEKTRQRIFQVMDELGYRPHALARGLASRRSRILALVFPTYERGLGITELDFFTSAADAARQSGYHLVLWSVDVHDSKELAELAQLGLADGVILMEVHLKDARVALLHQLDFPFSMMGRCWKEENINYADIDFEQTIRDTLGYLSNLGHTQIGFINQSQEVFENGYGPVVRTQNAFISASQDLGLPELFRFCDRNPQAGYETCREFLEAHPELTALVVMNDRAVPGIMRAIADRGWRIPADFSLVSIVSSERMAEMMIPPLTIMSPPSTDMAKLAVELLIEQLEGRQREISQVLLPCKLIVRGSSGPARKT
jgi:DNA-binding LacI/PurR family transcriptional regulator